MDIFIIIVGILIVLAVLDLTVGVSNDAVNFLNSAIGAKVAPQKIILFIASLGILAGVTFSSGMMEVARKGIFFPGMFYMPELMYIFIGVMLTDVILLDTFNSLGLPTSTTVSIVFELLGAAVALSIIKILSVDGNLADLGQYINSAKALLIIMGILLSVVFAFSIGAIVQYITRLIFTFDFEKNLKRYGAIWGGIALTAILYFILIKGSKGASFMDSATKEWINVHSNLIILYSFIGWSIFLFVWQKISSFNILKIIILAGTFALAMAFAANDLVNFVGVPLAGLSAYTFANATDAPYTTLMTVLEDKVQTDTVLLLLAGGVMVVTLWISKKARTVTKTELSLARQDEGDERFESSILSRSIVRSNYNFFETIKHIIPDFLIHFVSRRMAPIESKQPRNTKDSASFDLLRASVNLTVASMLISFATSMKLPLSTTYVTFMVAMGSSLADKAWGRESAVYRVNGVLTVIGGWFTTAFVAFVAAFIMTTIIYFTGIVGIIFLAIFATFVVYHFYKVHRDKIDETDVEMVVLPETTRQAAEYYLKKQMEVITEINEVYTSTLKSLFEANLKALKKNVKRTNKISKNIDSIIKYAIDDIRHLEEDEVFYHDRSALSITTANNINNNINTIASNSFKHLDNQHTQLTNTQVELLSGVMGSIKEYFNFLIELYMNPTMEDWEKISSQSKTVRKTIRKAIKQQLKILKNEHLKTRQALLSIQILEHSEQLVANLTELYRINHHEIDIENI